MVPTGTLRTTSSPSRPVLFEPSPWRPRCALYSGLKRKCTSVLWRSLDSIITSPPRPPSPPEGPPRGTYFSRRNARQPLPPSPALMRMRASSRNCIEKLSPGYGRRPLGIGTVELLGRLDVDKLAHAAPVAEIDHAGHLGEQGIVLAP